MLDMKELLAFSVEAKASDVHIAVGIPPKLRICLLYTSDAADE